MKCVNCGFENKDGAKFCTRCGVNLAKAIPAPVPVVSRKKSGAGKWLLIVFLCVVIFGGMASAAFFIGLPAFGYLNAVNLENNGEYIKAAEAFDELGGFTFGEILFNAGDRAAECMYSAAVELGDGGDFDDAIEILEKLDNYPGAEKKIEEYEEAAAPSPTEAPTAIPAPEPAPATPALTVPAEPAAPALAEPAPAPAVEPASISTDYFTDEHNPAWIQDPDALEEGLRYFSQMTGVLPYLYLTDEIDGHNSPTSDEVETFARNKYDELFTDENHLLFVFFEHYESDYAMWYMLGNTADDLLDEEDMNILMDALDLYYSDNSLSDEEYFSTAFSSAAYEIMNQPAEEIPSVPVEVTPKSEYLASLEYAYEMEELSIIDAYWAWDSEINRIYGLLQEKLPEDEMAVLRESELNWISYKDEAAAGVRDATVGGDSEKELAYYTELLTLTKQRTLYLVDYYFD